jgi:CubicO group peptidase (beta-lactamase class C family)
MSNKRPDMPDVTNRSNWPQGGGGMQSTASDYARFAQMLLNGGELDGVRLLSPSTVAFMTSDQLPPDVAYSPAALQILRAVGYAPPPREGQGYGLGVAVRTQEGRNRREGSPGDFYWIGVYGTDFWVDPKEKLVAVFMTQVAPGQGSHYYSLIRNLVYQALVK